MSGAGGTDGRRQPRRTHDELIDDLVAMLRKLGPEVDGIRERLNQNEVVLDDKLKDMLDLTGDLLAVHLPQPNPRVRQALEILHNLSNGIWTAGFDKVPEDRTYAENTRLGAVGVLRIMLDATAKSAKLAFQGKPVPELRRRITARIDKKLVAAFLAELEAFRAVVKDVEAEQDANVAFVQEGELVTYYVRDMTLEINLARMILRVNDVSLDLGALVDTIEEIRDVTDRFRATVLDWFGRVGEGLIAKSTNLDNGVLRLVTSIRALGGMMDDGDDMLLIRPGSFTMGIPEAESKRENIEDWDKNARPQHPVTIQRPFLLGKYPVTRGEYAEFVRDTNREWKQPDFEQTDRHPAVNVSFEDAEEYVKWLSRRTGHTYRLPGEAEWEYACRAGTPTARYWGEKMDRSKANIETKGTTPVGVYPPNLFGLHDMLGNVWEWTADPWHDNYDEAPEDGSVWETNGDTGRRVVRGGSWNDNQQDCRAGLRDGGDTGVRDFRLGFRVARTL